MHKRVQRSKDFQLSVHKAAAPNKQQQFPFVTIWDQPQRPGDKGIFFDQSSLPPCPFLNRKLSANSGTLFALHLPAEFYKSNIAAIISILCQSSRSHFPLQPGIVRLSLVQGSKPQKHAVGSSSNLHLINLQSWCDSYQWKMICVGSLSVA